MQLNVSNRNPAPPATTMTKGGEMKEITIKVREDANLYVSDILCFLSGFLLANEDKEFYGKQSLVDAVRVVDDLNIEIKRELQ